jgi:hypothetical protein
MASVVAHSPHGWEWPANASGSTPKVLRSVSASSASSDVGARTPTPVFAGANLNSELFPPLHAVSPQPQQPRVSCLNCHNCFLVTYDELCSGCQWRMCRNKDTLGPLGGGPHTPRPPVPDQTGHSEHRGGGRGQATPVGSLGSRCVLTGSARAHVEHRGVGLGPWALGGWSVSSHSHHPMSTFPIPQLSFPADTADLAAFVSVNDEATSDEGECEPGHEDIERELWSSVCMSEFLTALKGVQVALQLASTQRDLDGAITNLEAVASTKVDLEGVYLVCDGLPGVFDRRWGPGAASALVDEADRVNLERRRLLCVDGFSILPASLAR